MRLFSESAMKIFPNASTATPEYSPKNKDAEVASPPSPEKLRVPLPATVVMTPPADTFRMRLFCESAMMRFMEASTTSLENAPRLKDAEVAGPPSPKKPRVPLPATVVMTPPADTFRMRLLPASTMNRFPDASTATSLGAHTAAEGAGVPSPEKPAVPLPATVVMMPPCPLAPVTVSVTLIVLEEGGAP